MTFASDIDYVRGIHSWRGGLQIDADWFRATLQINYLGTYTFSSLDAYEAGTPILYTRSHRRPAAAVSSTRAGRLLFQDDIRDAARADAEPGRALQLQTTCHDRAAFEPRFGMTWAPTSERQDDAARQRRDLPQLAAAGI